MGVLYRVNTLFLKELKRIGEINCYPWKNSTEEVGEKIVLLSKSSRSKLKIYKILRIFFLKNV